MGFQAPDLLVVTSLPFIKVATLIWRHKTGFGDTRHSFGDTRQADTPTFLSHLLPSLLHCSKEKTAAAEVLFNLEGKGWSRAAVWILALKICIFPLTSGMSN